MAERADFVTIDDALRGEKAQGYHPLRPTATPWVKKLFEIADRTGGRIRFLEAFEKVGPLIPPGRGYRKALLNRAYQRHARGTDPDKPILAPMDSVVRNGRRMMFRDSLKVLVKNGRITMTKDEDNTEWIEINREWRPKQHARY